MSPANAAALFDLPRGAPACRIVVAMSGGVDSSVVAALAAASGAEVVGVTLQLYDYGAATGRKGACCAGDDIRDARAVADRLGAWRKVVQLAVGMGIPVPAFSASLAYYDSYRSENLPANLIQAQRDYFGAHTYERTDQPGIFHSDWN